MNTHLVTTQQWEDISSGFYQFKNVHTGRCLADSFQDKLQVLTCESEFAEAAVDTQMWL